MARDAFGNEIPDPFGGTGGFPPLPPPPGPEVRVGGGPGSPLPPLPPIPGPGGPGRPGPGRGPRGGTPWPLRLAGFAVRWTLALAVLAGIGYGGLRVADAVTDNAENARRTVSSFRDALSVPRTPVTAAPGTTAPGREAPGVPATPPTGFGRGSLLLRSNFADGLRLLRAEGSRVRLLRVAPGRIDASVVGGGRLKQVQVTWQGRVTVSSSTPSGSEDGLLALDTIVRAAPFRLVRSAAERAGRSPAAIDYVVALALPSQRWSAFLKDGGGQFAADAQGRITRRIG